MAWKLFGARDGEARKPVNDKFAMATRQRRMFTAQMRVDSFPGFGKFERRWCDPRTAFELDEKRTDLGSGLTLQWRDADALAAALRAAAAVVPAGPGFATFGDEPEARWIEAAALGDLLTAIATALPGLPAGVTLLAGDRALVLDPTGPAGTLHGDWPAEFAAALGA
jgi:hypothetical protein